MPIRDKTREGCINHILAYTPTSSQLLLGDSHTERLVWKFPTLAPKATWICGVGGDRISQLAWRVANEEGIGYSQHTSITGPFQRIGIMAGSNDILIKRMTEKQLNACVSKMQGIVDAVRQRWPDAQVTVFPIPPVPTRGTHERDPMNVVAYNLALLRAGLVAEECEWGEMDLERDFEDHVHLTTTGYLKWWNMIKGQGFE
ncbi:SGNH hydrolase-type esterase domain-containing protein [Obelidium mucronatum]|nr:SGNH hydrolase-type esterase domain-containing protein [Obelidium mucronatum]